MISLRTGKVKIAPEIIQMSLAYKRKSGVALVRSVFIQRSLSLQWPFNMQTHFT